MAQRQGIALALTNFAIDWMKQKGMTIAMIETGADPGHAPARSTYEKAGWQGISCMKFLDTIVIME